MNHFSHTQLLEALNWRYAVKSFDPERKISRDIWMALEESLLLTPSSYGLQPWKFFVIESAKKKEELRAASWNQKQVTDCSHYVVFAHRNRIDENYIDFYVKDMAQKRGIEIEVLSGMKKSILADIVNGPRSKIIPEWAARQTYIALGNFMTAAAVIGVDACPMEGLDPARYDEILGIKGTDYQTSMACAAGYRSANDRFATMKKVRFSSDNLVVRL